MTEFSPIDGATLDWLADIQHTIDIISWQPDVQLPHDCSEFKVCYEPSVEFIEF